MTGIRTAVVGVGHLGASHARIYGELPQASLVGVYDIDRNRNLEVAGSLGVRAFSSIEEVTVEAEAVSLAVPTDMHYSLGKYLLSAGMHVL
ncbi:MAG: Gfo/Idh/MocA family oxidoreductase, partial [Gemmatimonadota bacterium]|nr:Gfo/Idh/MocA family oxidoreductase [Gemmatimonadota bacterium]